jgi:hypothetical protein
METAGMLAEGQTVVSELKRKATTVRILFARQSDIGVWT